MDILATVTSAAFMGGSVLRELAISRPAGTWMGVMYMEAAVIRSLPGGGMGHGLDQVGLDAALQELVRVSVPALKSANGET